MDYLREIESIRFGVLSAEQIRNQSVCEVYSSKLGVGKTDKISGRILLSEEEKINDGITGTVYDPRLGTIDKYTKCETCGENSDICTGHFGHINLMVPLIHPGFAKQIVLILKCFCKSRNCSRLLITEDHLELVMEEERISNIRSNRNKFDEIVSKFPNICSYCSETQPDVSYNNTKNCIVYITKLGKEKETVDETIENLNIKLDSISDDDLRLIGFDPEFTHPRNYILTVFPVIPTCSRPCVVTKGNVCDDDLTIQLVEIIKANNHLRDKNISDANRNKYINILFFHISTFFDNKNGKSKHTANRRPRKSLKERISNKDGHIRANCVARRSDMTARTVITPDPTLRMNQVAIPEDIAKVLTIPVTVNRYNIEKMQEIVNKGNANFVIRKNSSNVKIRKSLSHFMNFKGTTLKHGDIIERPMPSGEVETFKITDCSFVLHYGDRIKRNDEYLADIKYPRKRLMRLQYGDIVERQLKDGDMIMINRAPTLWKGSFLAFETVVRPYKTLRMQLSSCGSFNADFDGDEINSDLL